MAQTKRPELSDGDKRALGVDLFNLTWTYMEMPERSAAENDRMLEAAYASAHFWSQVGSVEHLARSQWQLSRVHTVLGRAAPAIYHAQRCLDHCIAGDLWGWDRPFAYEALARAYAIAGDSQHMTEHLATARELGERIAEKDDRDLLLADLETIALKI